MNWILKMGSVYAALAAVAISGANCSSTTTAGSCTTDADCASDELCDTATSTCVGGAECTTDTDCDSPDVCTDSVCVPPSSGCTDDSDCTGGDVCDSGSCVPFAGCLTDDDCLAGETCDSGACTGTPTTEPSCQQCACTDLLSMGGCADLCKMGTNGQTTPNFCDGVSALPECSKCLMDNCGTITDPPVPTDPTSCM